MPVKKDVAEHFEEPIPNFVATAKYPRLAFVPESGIMLCSPQIFVFLLRYSQARTFGEQGPNILPPISISAPLKSVTVVANVCGVPSGN